MKMLKKAGAIAIAGAMVMSLGTISALAEGEALTLGAIEYTPATAENTIATFKVPYTAAAGVNQVTLLAELGATEGVFANAIAYETTAYIDQEAADTYFEFKIDDSRLQLAEGQKKLFLNVKVGGTGVATPATKSLDITPKSAEPTVEEIVSAAVKTAYAKDAEGVAYTNVFGLTDAAIVRMDITNLVTVQEGATAVQLDLSANKVTVDGNPAYYTLYNGKTKLIALVDSSLSAHNVKVIPDSEGTPRRYYGDITMDGSFTAGDISGAVAEYNTNGLITELTDLSSLLADIDGNTAFTAGDISGAVAAYNTNGAAIPSVEN